MLEDFELILPSEKYLSSYIEVINEYKDNNITTYAFADTSRGDIFERFESFRTGDNLPQGYVKSTTLWLVCDEDFIGEISIRHGLTEALMRFGGNIGYGVRYSWWNKGIGTIMLSKALVYAKEEIGLLKVLITCNDTNIGSARVIEKNGGVLEDKIINIIDGKERITRRYWINIA